MKLFISFLIFTIPYFAQERPRQLMLDSINNSRQSDKGIFNLYIKKPEIEIIGGVFRNRETVNQDFESFNFTYNTTIDLTQLQNGIYFFKCCNFTIKP